MDTLVKGRQILGTSLIANEIIDSIVRKKGSGFLCKLDIEKAYDHISWGFILRTLQKMGFGEKSVKRINWCISTLSFSVVNGSPTDFIKSSRGLRKGDPLSPDLFVLGMETLSLLLDKAIGGGYLSRFSFKMENSKEEVVSHLLFADDTLVFCNYLEDQLTHLA